MDQQLRCTKEGHQNKLIDGICMEKSCKADQKILCIKCLQTIHEKCHNRFYDQDEFIKKLTELKTQTKESVEITQLRQATQEIINSMKVFQQFMNQIFVKYEENHSHDVINKIIKNQHILSANDWKIGYELLTSQSVSAALDTKWLIEQLNKIQTSLHLITNKRSPEQDNQPPDQRNQNNSIIIQSQLKNPYVDQRGIQEIQSNQISGQFRMLLIHLAYQYEIPEFFQFSQLTSLIDKDIFTDLFPTKCNLIIRYFTGKNTELLRDDNRTLRQLDIKDQDTFLIQISQ